MKKILILLTLVVLGVIQYKFILRPPQPGFELEPGYSYLYDGNSLQGWRVIGGESTFESSGESIVGRHGPGENTFLRTEESYADFSLKMQMRWDEPGNSGVLFRAAQRDGDGRAYGYQYELDHSDRAWSGGVYDEARRGWLYSLKENEAARQAIRLDGWNDIEIEARGPRLKTWINGVLAADVVDGLDARGFIALQVHAGDVGVMRWRRIRIKTLAALENPPERLEAAMDWRVENVTGFSTGGGILAGTFVDGSSAVSPRRQLGDALVRMTVPACDHASVIRVRYTPAEKVEASFAEVTLYADRAEARLVTPDGEVVLTPRELDEVDQHDVTVVMLGNAITLTVGEQDVLRRLDAGLADRGQLRIEPAACQQAFSVTDFEWVSLEEKSSEVLFYQTLETAPAPVLSPEQALEAFRVAPGFEVELVAAEPLVEDPVAMAWDEYGRLYVVEMRGYMPDAYGTGSEEPVGQVVRLEDTDGDGRMDSSEVFLDKLINPRAVAVVNEGVLVGEPPHLWLCEVPDKQSLCQSRSSVGDYASDVETANVEHMENRLLPGLDNWLYNSKSARRMRLADDGLQVEEGLFRGQWGITKDNYGRLLYNHNSTWLQADLFAAEDLVEPGTTRYPPGLGVRLTPLSEVFSVRVNPGVNRAYLEGTLRDDGRLHKATGVSGLVAYRGDQFPDVFRNDVFVPEVAGNVVAQFALTEDNLELLAEQRLYDEERWGKRDFLGSTDERFRPVDAYNGPDGALYIVDMYRGIVQDDHFLTEELREQIFQRQLDTPLGMGRIWRVRHSDGKTDRHFPPLVGASDEQLLAALAHANGWVRDTAQRLLIASRGTVKPLLVDVASGADTLAAIHAIWVLQGRGELDRGLVLRVANREDPKRQIQVLRAGRDQLQLEDINALYVSLADAPEAVRMQLVFVAGDFVADETVRGQLLQMLVADIANPYISQAVLRAVQGEELLFMRELLAGNHLETRSKQSAAVLRGLSANAYRSLRGELSTGEPANPLLQELLVLIESRRDKVEWQQVVMLKGFKEVIAQKGFVPAQLAIAPTIFVDGSLSQNDPLWAARLAGRRAFTWPGDEVALGLEPLGPEQLQLVAKGEIFYARCATCHGETGAGTPDLAPPLASTSWVTGPAEWLGRIILQGMNGPVEVAGQSWDGLMPPHGHIEQLDDETLAGLMTYMRRSWGNTADPVSVEVAAGIRASSAGRSKPWTSQELQSVPFDRGFGRYVGKYSISFVTVTVTEESDGLHMSVPMYGGGLMSQIDDTSFTASAGGEEVEVEFVIETDGSVNEFILHRQGEQITVTRSAE